MKNNNVGAGAVSAQKSKGITLVALIITIIVMLILVSVSVQILINSNLIGTAEDAGEKTKIAYEQEKDITSTIKVGDQVIDEYIDSIGKEKIKFYIKYTGGDTPLEYTVTEGTTWEQFLSKNQIPHHIDGISGELVYCIFSTIDENWCQMLGMPDEALGAYSTALSGGGPFLEEGVNFQTGPWIFPDTFIKDGATYQ